MELNDECEDALCLCDYDAAQCLVHYKDEYYYYFIGAAHQRGLCKQKGEFHCVNINSLV